MLSLVLLFGLKTFCFLCVFFWISLPQKCLGSICQLMVTIFGSVIKMGCWFSKSSKDEKQAKTKKYQTNLHGKSLKSALGHRPSNTAHAGAYQQSQNVHRASEKLPTKPIDVYPRSELGNYSLAAGGSNIRNTMDYVGSIENDHNKPKTSPIVYNVNEDQRYDLRKVSILPIQYSLPAAPLKKSPVNEMKKHRTYSSSYDSNTSSIPVTLQRNTVGYPNNNAYQFINRNKAEYGFSSIKGGRFSVIRQADEQQSFPINKLQGSSLITAQYQEPPKVSSARSTLITGQYKEQPKDSSGGSTLITAQYEGQPKDSSAGSPLITAEYKGQSKDSSAHNKNRGSSITIEFMNSDVSSAIQIEQPLSLPVTQVYPEDTNPRYKDSIETKRIKLTPPETKRLSTEEILSKLESGLRHEYKNHLTFKEVHHFHFEVCTLEELGRVQRKPCFLPQLFQRQPKWKMLVYGKPFFGKTQLCRDITAVWTLSSTEETGAEYANLTAFKILINHTLMKESVSDLEGYLVDKCYKLLPKNLLTKTELKSALNSCAVETLFVFDGYDKLDQSDKQLVALALKKNFFGQASVLLTCRPDVDAKLRQSFSIHADICGLNDNMLLDVARKESLNKNNFVNSKVKELFGIAPLYAQAVVNVFRRDERPNSLYDLLNSVIELVTKTKSPKLNETIYGIIGVHFIHNLKRRQFIFDENTLKELLHTSWDDLQSLGLFIECPSKRNENKKVIVSHKLFVVYFAVRHLRTKWEKLVILPQRDVFLKGQLCFEDSSGVYLGTSEPTPKIYFAGLIPEIIFDFHNNVFQMIEDVPQSYGTKAFETQSLLLRVDLKRLPKYGITEVVDSNAQYPEIENRFASILNILDFWGVTVEKRVFVSRNSPLYYLKMAAIDEATNRLVMMSVVSTNPSKGDDIQEIYLDFLESDVKTIQSFLTKFGEIIFGSCQVIEEMSAGKLAFHFVASALTCRRDLYMQLALGSRSCNTSTLVTWEVVSSSRKKPISSFLYSTEKESVLKDFDYTMCQHIQAEPNRSRFIERMNDSVSQLPANQLGITINVKFKF